MTAALWIAVAYLMMRDAHRDGRELSVWGWGAVAIAFAIVVGLEALVRARAILGDPT